MEAITVFTANQEESRIIKAILEALKMAYKTKELTLEEMEAHLMPGQLKVWLGLKNAIQEVKSGTAVGTSFDDFLNELEYENSIA